MSLGLDFEQAERSRVATTIRVRTALANVARDDMGRR